MGKKKTFIIGASGKKQSGKNTLCDGLTKFFRLKFRYKDCSQYSLKMYSFADALKEKICMDVMGLSREQCYGSDEEKNSLTTYSWNRLPSEIGDKYRELKRSPAYRMPGTPLADFVRKDGFMTAREVMQIVGTNIFRKYFDDSIWVNATFRAIEKEEFDIALISDARFPSEVEGIAKNEGIIFRLLRDICDVDPHESEVALDDYDWESLGGNAYVIDNREMSIEEQNEETYRLMNSILKDKVLIDG